MSITLKVLNPTTLKRKPIQSSELPSDQKQPLPVSKLLELSTFEVVRDHVRCTFANDSFNNIDTWYAFGKHIEIRTDGKRIFPKAVPDRLKLDIPYKSQRDNEINPDGACNVTSLAMCLEFLRIKQQDNSLQFEDELYEYAETNGLNRHDPHDLAIIVEAYGCRDDFRTDATIDQVKEWLTDGKPVVTHGYFTDFGHIVVLAGFDESGFLVHDPYGEWDREGYIRNDPGVEDEKGKYIHYSYSLITHVCIPDGSFWVHFIARK